MMNEQNRQDLGVGNITLEIKPGFDKALLVELLRTIGSLC